MIALCAWSIVLQAQQIPEPPPNTFPIWNCSIPGAKETDDAPKPEIIVPNRPRTFYQLTQVSQPTLSVFRPDNPHPSQISVLVIPGGGLQRLAIEHEGYEVAEWLNRQGITAFVLKYRVPGPVDWGLSDAQRSMRWIRKLSKQYDLDPDNVGVVGFSAGGEIGTRMAALGDSSNYEATDSLDQLRCDPDFFGLIYTGGLVEWRSRELKTEIREALTSVENPVFIAHAMNDSFQNSLELLNHLAGIKTPVELHLYQSGGHGFGVRHSAFTASRWTSDWLDFLESRGHLRPRNVKIYGQQFALDLSQSNTLQPLSSFETDADLETAYLAQKAFVESWIHETGTRIGGFKGAAASKSAQESNGLPGPMSAVLFRSGWISAKADLKLPRLDPDPCAVETEIGYFFGADVPYEILNEEQLRSIVEWIAPVIELPANYSHKMKGKGVTDGIAANVGSHRYIVGKRVAAQTIDPDKLQIELHHEGSLEHAVKGSAAHRGQWGNLLKIVNQTIAQGYTIQRGQVILGGALGPIRAAKPGKYEANFGELGNIEFEITE